MYMATEKEMCTQIMQEINVLLKEQKSKPFVLLEMERFDKTLCKDNHLGLKRDLAYV